jgi:formylglycine-generating enzyme
MKKYLFVIFMITLTLSLNALGTLRVESIKELPATHTNLEVYDADGKYAPVLLVKTNLKGVGIQNVGRPTKHAPEYNSGDHQYKFYMNDNQRVIKLTHADYEPLEVRLLADFGINVKAQRVYEMVLTNVPEKEFINVVIISDPEDAEKIIDGKNMGTGQSFELYIGSHTLKLQKSGHNNISREIDVSKSKTLFNNLILQEVEPVMVTIKSTPKEAEIYIDNVNEGKTNKQLFKFPGEYSLRLVADKYDAIEKTIAVTESGSNTFNYSLQKNTSLLTTNTSPSNCDIYINNEKLSSNSKEVSAGMYRVEVKKDGYYEQNRTVNVEKGINKTESFTLEQKTGKLQFVVEPMEAQITLKKGSSTVQNWNGSKYLSSLAIGSYSITSSLGGYSSQTKQVAINLNETTKVNIILEKGKDVILSGTDGDFIFVQGGTFQMGSNEDFDERPIHKVTVSDFYISIYEVTQKEWKDVMGSNPSNWTGDNSPIENVSWYDAVKFCNKKSRADGLTPCYTGSGKNTKCNFSANGYRLPTEAEWEYAAKGGNKSKGYKYSGSNSIGDVAWYNINSNGRTHRVGNKKPNELGIYDMSGNLWEWCNDWKGRYSSSSQTNPKGALSGSFCVYRGGSKTNDHGYCRVASRHFGFPNETNDNLGFRLVRSP